MQQWLVQVWEEHRKTILLITHDVDEALFLSDRVYVLTPGRAGSSWPWRSTCPGRGPMR
jgi:putative hydroxymethylpyrimidine transport system ATP-binding protein